ncbi:aldo/keto reductase [Nocardia heshunensis]
MTDRMLTLNNGIAFPALGFGTWQLRDEVAERAAGEAFAAGYRSVDTAAAYGNERGVGRAVRDSGLDRSELFVTTKLVSREGYSDAVDSCRASLDRLGLEYLDLYLIHWPFDESIAETWRAFEDLYDAGLVRAIGVSNFSQARLEKLLTGARVRPQVNQVELHPRLSQAGMREYCAAQDIQIESWSPLMQGGELLGHPVLTDLAQAHDRTPAQIILRWHLQHGLRVIPRSTTPAHMRANADLFDFELSIADMRAIDALDEQRRANPLADPDAYVFGEDTYRQLRAIND